jgi:hypothetical protein
MLAMAALQIYVGGSVESWTAAGAFGQRRLVGLTALLTAGLAAMIARTSPPLWRNGLFGVIALCVWWNVALSIQFGSGLMNRQRLEPAKNAWTAFVVVPQQLPGLVYRYLFDRRSFYKAPEQPAAAADRRSWL